MLVVVACNRIISLISEIVFAMRVEIQHNTCISNQITFYTYIFNAKGHGKAESEAQIAKFDTGQISTLIEVRWYDCDSVRNLPDRSWPEQLICSKPMQKFILIEAVGFSFAELLARFASIVDFHVLLKLWIRRNDVTTQNIFIHMSLHFLVYYSCSDMFERNVT